LAKARTPLKATCPQPTELSSPLLSSPTQPPHAKQALVIGAGLSGSAIAHSLATRGWRVTVIDQASGVGAGASGLPAGLAAPHVSPDDNVLSRITRAGVAATLQRAEALLTSGTDWALTGVLEHNLAGKRRLPTLEANADPLNACSTQASTEQITAAGLPTGTPALWHARAGWIRPRQLVAAQLQTPGVQVLWGRKAQHLERHGEDWVVTDAQGQTLGQAPLLVVASAFDSLALLRPLPGFAVPLNPLRGQISFGHMHGLTDAQRQRLPPFPVNGHGSFISNVPTPDGQPGWYIGSTFERNCEQAPVREEDHAANQLRLATLLPDLGAAMQPQFGPAHVQGWAGLRCTLPNRLPAVGPIDSEQLPGLWLCAGMGARGISLAVLCGELTAAWLCHEPLPLAPALAKHLAAERYVGKANPP
jgi:tRNA 5-methylaminomethyl-2-thiouridine biosynthesis bifunctional protein